MEPASEYLAARIRELREDRRWAAQWLADQCVERGCGSLTRSTVAKIEAGVRQAVTFGEAVTLAEVLGVDLAELAPPAPRRRRPAEQAPSRPGICGTCGVVPRDEELHAGWHEKNDHRTAETQISND